MIDLNLPAGRDGKPRSWLMFFLRPVVLGPVTLFLLIIVAGLAYRSSRSAGIPLIDEIVDRETEGRIDIEPDENAFTFYERAFGLIPATLDEEAIAEAVDALGAGEVEWDAVSPAAKKSLEMCEAVLAEWQLGTELERGVQIQPADLQIWDLIEVQKSRTIICLALLKSAQCLDEDQSEEAWQWLRALFRFSRHIGNSGRFISRMVGDSCHAMLSKQFIGWASHKSVTTEHLQTAFIELQVINALTASCSVNVKAEYFSYMNLLSSPETVHEYFLGEHSFWGDPDWNVPEPLVGSHLFLNAEPQLSQLLLRHLFANHLSQCDLPRRERNVAGTSRIPLFLPTGKETPPLMNVSTLNDAMMRSMMAQHFIPSSIQILKMIDRGQARQAAYELCLTVEIFRRMHGEYPESLEALVPEILDRVPPDLFGSGPAERMLMIRRDVQVPEEPTEEEAELPRPGLIIYSRGVNGTDDGGDIARQTEDIGIRIPISSAPDLN
ncbi:MAG: hypothetical protein ACI93T_001753 [Porticoccaceae bacterium]|jgi:hypothetical protein